MSNREKAKMLREKQQQENQANTTEALASQKETEVQAESIEKIQQELENAKLLLEDTNEAKKELQRELEELNKENKALNALVEEKQKQIEDLKASNKVLAAENAKLKAKKK